MNARRRKDKSSNLEPNLYKNGVYFRYKHPVTGHSHSMGRDALAANNAARVLNEKLIKNRDLYREVLKLDKYTFSAVCGRYTKEYLPTKGLKASTLKITEYRIGRLEKDLGQTPLCDLSVERLATYLDDNFKCDPYIKHRGALIDIYKWAITKGIVKENPAEKTLAKNSAKKMRSPLSLEDFNNIRLNAEPWMQVAMDLALVSLQRRGDLCNLKYDDIHDGRMFIIQEKTEKHGVRARLSIEYGQQLESIINQSRADNIVTPYVLHERPSRIVKTKSKSHWCQILPDRLSKRFAAAREK